MRIEIPIHLAIKNGGLQQDGRPEIFLPCDLPQDLTLDGKFLCQDPGTGGDIACQKLLLCQPPVEAGKLEVIENRLRPVHRGWPWATAIEDVSPDVDEVHSLGSVGRDLSNARLEHQAKRLRLARSAALGSENRIGPRRCLLETKAK